MTREVLIEKCLIRVNVQLRKERWFVQVMGNLASHGILEFHFHGK